MQPAEGASGLPALIEPLRRIVGEAGEAILHHYRRVDGVAVKTKADKTPLTEADTAAHCVIERGLGALETSWPVLSEESEAIDLPATASWSRYWLVDPLDGTREFLGRSDEFTVNIALMEAGRPILGIVHAPVSQQCHWAWRGGGAWMSEGEAEPAPIRARPWDKEAGVKVVVSRSHPSPRVKRWLDALEWRHSTLPVGSSLKMCIIARGEADIYPRLGDTSLWDIAAADCVVSEAGGAITDLDGKPLRYQPWERLLNPYFIARADTSAPIEILCAMAKEAIAGS